MRRQTTRFVRNRNSFARLSTKLNLEALEDRFAPAVGLMLGLGFDEGAGTTVADASGQLNAGALSGPTWTTAGKFGSALSFDGQNDWVTVNDSNSLDLTTGMTIEAWVNPASLGGYNSVLVKEASNAVGLAYQLYANNGYPQPSTYIYTSTDHTAAGTSQLPLNTWSHLAATYDSAMLRLYVNGTQVGSSPNTVALLTTTNPFRIGGDAPFGEYFHGLIDEVRVYNRALSAAEIQTDMATPVGGGGPVLPVVTIAATDSAAAETSSDPAVFTVTRSGDTSAALSVNYSIGGAASNGSDYTTLSGSVTLPIGAASATITVTPIDDTAVEGSETVVLTLSSSANYNVGAPAAGTATIADNEAAPGSFQESIVFSGLNQPTVIRFAPDGRIFVAEKSGIIKVFDSLADPTGDVFADLRTQVHNFWDRGLLGMALDPNFDTDPYVYVLYSADADINGTFPKYGSPGVDSDPGPSATGNGALISGRLSRLEAAGNFMTGPENVLVWDWVNQFPSHSIGTLEFGPDGALYASAGDGASFNYVDYGQTGNPFNDPANEGGALRSQDLRSAGDPVSLDGSIIRIDPDNGAGLSDNPLFGNSDPNAQRIVAYGMRNPFRFTVRPGTNEIWSGDVGWNSWEEINRIVNPTDGVVDNFGWPAYEGVGRQSGYDSANLPLLEALYSEAGAVVSPYYSYNHGAAVVSGSGEPTGSSAITGMAFYEGGTYPAQFQDALFFCDYSRNRIWVMFKGANGLPDPTNIATFVADANGPVYLTSGPNGDIYYCGLNDGTIRRMQFFTGNQPPSAAIQANTVSGNAPLTVDFSGAGSTDPDVGATLSYSWDLNGDGTFGDSTVVNPSFTYTAPGNYTVSLRVTDNGGLADTASIGIDVNSTPPTPFIDTPLSSLTWQVGQSINFTGHATDLEQGSLPASALSWTLTVHHGQPPDDHVHTVQTFPGVASGSFVAPDHEYPSFLELILTATDADGLQSSTSVQLQPQTVQLTAQANPSVLTVGLGDSAAAGTLTETAIQGSTNTVSAASPQTVNNVIYQFASWSDGGAATHNVVANATATYSANFNEVAPTIAISDASLTEGNSGSAAMTFTVTLSSARTVPVTVSYATQDVSATGGSDYTAVTATTLTFAPGQLSRTVTVSVTGDVVSESSETFVVNLSNPGNGVLGDNQGIGTIVDDDAVLLGADSFGYKAYTTTYENLNLGPGAAGVFTIRNTGDNNTNALNIGNSLAYFRFYNTDYTQLHISTNGLITFSSGNNAASNTNLTSSPSQAAIAPMWDDWINVSGQTMVLGRFEETNGDGYYDRLIIEWNNVQGKTTSPSPVTFQAILQLNSGTTPGTITFNYPDLNAGNFRSNGGSATIGIKAAGTQGGNRILVSQNNPNNANISSGKAIRIVYAPGAVSGVSAVAPRASAPQTQPKVSKAALDQAFALAAFEDEVFGVRKKSIRRGY